MNFIKNHCLLRQTIRVSIKYYTAKLCCMVCRPSKKVAPPWRHRWRHLLKRWRHLLGRWRHLLRRWHHLLVGLLTYWFVKSNGLLFKHFLIWRSPLVPQFQHLPLLCLILGHKSRTIQCRLLSDTRSLRADYVCRSIDSKKPSFGWSEQSWAQR